MASPPRSRTTAEELLSVRESINLIHFPAIAVSSVGSRRFGSLPANGWLVSMPGTGTHRLLRRLNYSPKTLAEYLKLGLPADVVAPTGGRAMLVRSTDQGKTWSKPEMLIDTPADDRHPAFVELQDGTVLCSFFTYAGEPKNGDPVTSPQREFGSYGPFDHGRTWERSPADYKRHFCTMRRMVRFCGSETARF